LKDCWEIAILLYKYLKDVEKHLSQFVIWSHNEIISPRKKRKEETEPISDREIASVHSEYKQT
jgi:hypothetical protein